MIIWPFDLFPAQEVKWTLRGVALSGGTALAGFPTMAKTDGGGIWVCEMSGIVLRKKNQIKAARALDWLMDGGASKVIVDACECGFGPSGFSPSGGVPHSDGTSFSDGSLYAGAGFGVIIHSAASLRSTQVVLTLPEGIELEGGEAFSVVHPVKGTRRYGVARILSQDDRDVTVEIRPPLREALAGGEHAEFCKPANVMRLANPDEFMEAIRMGRFGSARPVFVEAF